MSPASNDVHVDVEGRTLKLSNLDKVLYPGTGTTKGEVLNYYASISGVLLPHLADRPVTRIASVPSLAPVPNANPASTGSASKFGAHDPRLLDEVMRSTPDMKAFAKLAPKQHR